MSREDKDMETTAPSTPEVATPEATATDNEPISVGTTKEAPEAKAPESVTEKEFRKWKLNVYGKEEEVDEPELIRRAQKASAADQRFQKASEAEKKAAEIEKNYQGMVKEFEQNPWKIFEVLGKNAHEAAEQLLINKLKYEQASPEQKRLWELEQENMSLKERQQLAEKQRAEQAEAASAAQYNEVKSREANTIDTGVADAIREAGFKKPTPAIVRKVAQKMLAYHSANDGELLDPKIAMQHVLVDLRDEAIEVFGGMPEAEYEQYLPKEFTEKLRKHFISQVQSSPVTPRRSSDATSPASSGKRVQSSTDSFFKSLDKKYG